jgi:hypothetical protein
MNTYSYELGPTTNTLTRVSATLTKDHMDLPNVQVLPPAYRVVLPRLCRVDLSLELCYLAL